MNTFNKKVSSDLTTLDKNIDGLKWIKWVEQIFKLFRTSLNDVKENFNLFKNEFITVDSIWDYTINLKDPQDENFKFGTDLTYITAIPMTLWLMVLEEWYMLKDEDQWPEGYIDSLLERIKISTPVKRYTETAYDMVYWSDSEFGWLEWVRAKYYTDEEFSSIPSAYNTEPFMAVFQLVFKNRYVHNMQKINEYMSADLNVPQTEIMDIIDELKDAVEMGEYKDIHSSISESDLEWTDIESQLKIFGTYTNNNDYDHNDDSRPDTVEITIWWKTRTIEADELINTSENPASLKMRLFHLECEAANIINHLTYNNQTTNFAVLWLSTSKEFYLDFDFSYDLYAWFTLSASIEHQIELEDETDPDESKNIEILKLIWNEVSTVSELKSSLIKNKSEIEKIKWSDCYNELFEQVKLLIDIERSPEKYVWKVIESI